MSGESKREPMFSANQKSGYTPWVQGALKEWNIEGLSIYGIISIILSLSAFEQRLLMYLIEYS